MPTVDMIEDNMYKTIFTVFLIFLTSCVSTPVPELTPTLSFDPVMAINGSGDSPLALTLNKEVIANFVGIETARVVLRDRLLIVENRQDFLISPGMTNIHVESDGDWRMFFAATDGSRDVRLDFETIKE